MPGGPTFITVLEPPPGAGPTLAVKDNIDVAGVVTTCGSKLVASTATPAVRDAVCVTTARGAGARIVGKTNLVELAYGAEGVNPWFGTPVNPLDPSRVPGGSSSGSAVAVAVGVADVAFGTDSGGSVRIPAACCGIYGLKTTLGRVSTDGVRAVAPSLDVVGPMAATIDDLATGMRLLDPTFVESGEAPDRVGRVRVPVAPHVDAAVDAALERLGAHVVDVDATGWIDAWRATMILLDCEGTEEFRTFLAQADLLDPVVADRLRRSAERTPAEHDAASVALDAWRAELDACFEEFGLLALPTIPDVPPRLDDFRASRLTALTASVNGAGVPALSMPVGAADPIPASLMLVGPRGAEEQLVATARAIEAG
ncbi:MAG: amidase [Acidimicrobiia bacterium]